MSIFRDCGFDDGPHEYLDNWVFGGANSSHPGADPRFKPAAYYYYDENLHLIWTTSTPLCDDQAIDEFTKVANISPSFKPVYLAVRRPDTEKQEMLPIQYDKARDTAWDLIPT